METLTIQRVDDVYIKVLCEPGAASELRDYFSYTVPGYRFMPSYKTGKFDGKIRLYNMFNKRIRAGLLQKVEDFARYGEYDVEYASDFNDVNLSVKEFSDFLDRVNPNPWPYDFQIKALVKSIRKKRRLLLSATGSGKSLILYLLTQWYKNEHVLIVVPDKGLVNQVVSDFADYGCQEPIHKIYGGLSKDTNKRIIVSTWQSIYKLPKEWFSRFKVVLGDEVHTFAAKSLQELMDKLEECPNRIGVSGTLDGSKSNELVLIGMFGGIEEISKTHELQERGILAPLSIKAIVFNYAEAARQRFKKGKFVPADNKWKKFTYSEEVDWVEAYEPRNRFIKNLALSLEDNTLLLFRHIEHGKMLHDMIKAEAGDRPVHLIWGGVDVDDREVIRKIVETQKGAIIVASSGTFSRGINIKQLYNIINVSPLKAVIQNLQSIGRTLRQVDGKEATLFDLADDLSWKKTKNFMLKHFVERVKIYVREKFRFKQYNVELKDE